MNRFPMRVTWAGCLAFAMVMFCGTAGADPGLGRHKKVYAVPVPGKVVVDGQFKDWDLSGQIQMYVVSETADMQSARFAMMYDEKALYVSGEVRDPTPMMNRHDPEVDGDKGWDADSCQFRMTLDPKMGYPINIGHGLGEMENPKLVHLILWYYTDRREPCLQMFASMKYKSPRPAWGPFGVVPRDGYEAAYRKMDDGRGYTFEYRLPWNTLGVQAPLKGGDLVAGTAQFNWSAPDGLHTAGGSAWAYDVMAGPGFPYQHTGCWGKIIFSEKGHLAKELVEEGLPPEKPLPLKFTYNLPEESEATVQLFDDKGMCVRTLVASGARRAGENVERWDGLDNAGKPLGAGKYAWKGLYHRPIKTKFILSAHNSGQPPYKLDDKTGGWGGDHGIATCTCAVPDGMLIAWNICESGWGIIRTDLKGKKLWGSSHSATHLASDGQRMFTAGDYGFEQRPGVGVFDLKDSRPLNFSNKSPVLPPPDGGNPTNDVVTGIAYHNGIVYVSYAARNLVALYDAVQGTFKSALSIEKPGRLAAEPKDLLYVISDKKVVTVKDGKLITDHSITDHLDQPTGLAVAPDGTRYVANAGKLQNISVFSADGKYVKSIGKEGGRPRVGRYDPSGILEPGGIALDQVGNLWVAETLDSPKRQSVWNTKTGALVSEFFGASSYFGWAYIDPKHPDELYCHNVLWKIDLNTGKCVPQSTIWRPTAPNMIADPNPGGYAGHFRVMTAKNGKQYGFGMIDYSNMLFIRDGDVFKPFVGTIRVTFGQYGSGLLYPVMKELYEKTKAGAYMWQDKNNDQTVQEDELSVSAAGRGEATFNWVDPDLNVWCDAGWMYKPVRFEPDGRPVYDFSKSEPLPFKGGNANGTSLIPDDKENAVYTLAPGGEPGFARFTRDGKLVWGYGGIIPWASALSLPMISPGKLYGLTMPLGLAGDFTGASCYFGPYHLFTRDGIYVAMIMRDGRDGKGLGADITASEVITGQLVKPDGMNRYFLLAGDQDGRVTEILGLDTVKRLPDGEYVHSEEQVKLASNALAEYEHTLAKSKRLDIVRGRGSLDSAKPVVKNVDDNRSFTARAAYDDKNLYVAYDVSSPNELVNEASDPKLIFKGGNLLDIQLATDPSADAKRKTPAPGDVRILVTRQQGKPMAVVYRPKVKGFTGSPIVLTSPTGKESFDAIEPTDRVALDYQKSADGFRAVATIPLDLIGWKLKPGDSLKMDVGYIFGNAPGTHTALRAYWMNNSFSAGVANDIPNESRLEPTEWGAATVE